MTTYPIFIDFRLLFVVRFFLLFFLVSNIEQIQQLADELKGG